MPNRGLSRPGQVFSSITDQTWLFYRSTSPPYSRTTLPTLKSMESMSSWLYGIRLGKKIMTDCARCHTLIPT